MSESAPETPGDWPETHDTSIRRLKNLGCIYAENTDPRFSGRGSYLRRGFDFYCLNPFKYSTITRVIPLVQS